MKVIIGIAKGGEGKEKKKTIQVRINDTT